MAQFYVFLIKFCFNGTHLVQEHCSLVTFEEVTSMQRKMLPVYHEGDVQLNIVLQTRLFTLQRLIDVQLNIVLQTRLFTLQRLISETSLS